MRTAIARILDSPRATWWAAAFSLALGLFFTFVWAPHPWGWRGIDQYHELARALARGEPFGTTDVPWGYAYFVGTLYRIFGEHAWLPVVVQVVANATVPLLLYALAVPLAGTRVAAMAALLTGVLSFNTIYASTQASDAICTVLFLASLVWFEKGLRSERTRDLVVSALLAGLVPQFRPNMILFPLVMAAAVVVIGRSTRALLHAAVLVAGLVIVVAPWVVRNYWLTGMFLPTSTHGGVQLWYGTVQVGEYLEHRAANPRSAFEPATFDYTSMADQPIVVEALRHSCLTPGTPITLVYWTDRDSGRRAQIGRETTERRMVFEIPGQPMKTAVYYVFEAPGAVTLPPSVYFVDDDHLADLDRHHDVVDIFDLVRAIRYLAWREGAAATEPEMRALVVRLLGGRATPDVVVGLEVTADAATLRLRDGTSLQVPRSFSGRITDLVVTGSLDRALVSAHRPAIEPPPPPIGAHPCLPVEGARVNDVFYRREPHQMRRYTALALDNIARNPMAFVTASAYRMFRLFVVRGTGDRAVAQQFSASDLVYRAGFLLSVSYLIVFAAGVVIAWKRHRRLLWLLIPIAYVPLTICFVLTNMRYTITVQPLVFIFVALTFLTALDLDHQRDTAVSSRNEVEPRMAARRRGGLAARSDRGQ
jgi:hypothetical protein